MGGFRSSQNAGRSKAFGGAAPTRRREPRAKTAADSASRSGRVPLREDFLLARIRSRVGRVRAPILVGPGHDAALVGWPRGRDLVLKTDQVVGGVHFVPGRDRLDLVGHKAVSRALSDVAAFGGEPVAALVAAALPPRFRLAEFDALLRGLLRACRESGTALVGGDLSRIDGPLVVSVSIAARAPARGPKLRDGARPGDRILVTGRLGGSLLGRHLRLRPRLSAGRALVRVAGVHAMMDVSDGLLKDLSRLARSSGLAAVVEPERVPVHPDARRLARSTGRPPREHALSDGEDHELLLAVAPAAAVRLARRGLPGGLRLTDIGRFRRGRGLFLRESGLERPVADLGHEHRFD